MKKYLFALFLGFISVILFSQNTTNTYDLTSEIPKDTTAIRGELPNGLKYYIKENDRPKEEVSLRLVVNVGHLQEDDKQLGLAHLLEHMGFNGTKHFKKDKLVKYFESIGLTFGHDLNAHTGFEETVYKLKVPSKDLRKVDKAFQILEDWAHNMTLKDEAIDAERPVVLEEFRARLGSGNRVGTEVANFMYKGMPQLRYFSDDKLENIKNFKTEHLRRFYKDWYRPNLMGIIVAGDIDASYVEKKIKKHFSKLVNPENEKPLIFHDSVPYQKTTRVKLVTDPEKTNTTISLSFFDKSPLKRNRPVIQEIEKKAIIKSMLLSIVNERLTELALASNAPFIFSGVNFGGGLSGYHKEFSINASSKEDGVVIALKAMVNELERVSRYGVTKIELKRVKENMLASNETFFEQKDDWFNGSYLNLLQAEFQKEGVFFDKNWRYNFYKTIIPTITLDEIKTFFDTYYHKDNRMLIVTAPEKEGLTLPTKEVLLDAIEKSEINPNILNYIPKELDNQLIKNLRPKGSIVSEENHLYAIKELVLSNGAKVYYKKTDFDKESIQFKAFSYGGKSIFSDKDATGVCELLGFASYTGVGGYKIHELSKILAGKKAKVSTTVSKYDEKLKGFARAQDLEIMFQLIYLNFTSINKDEEMYLSLLEKIKSILKNRKLKPSTIFKSAINEVTQKGNPRFIDMDKNNNLEKLFDSIKYADIHNTYIERFKNAGDFKFFFIGDFEEDILKNYIEKYIASLPSSKKREKYVLEPYKNILKGEEIVVRKGLEDKANLIINFVTEGKSQPKEVDAIKMFGQIFKIRLREKIREEQGGSYSVNTSFGYTTKPFEQFRGSIRFTCAPENVETLELESLQLLKNFLKEGPTKKELDNIKKSWVLKRNKARENNWFWFKYMYNKVHAKKSFNNIDDYEKQLSKITPKFVKKTANKYINEPSYTAKLLPESKNEKANNLKK